MLYFCSNFTETCPRGLINNKPAFVQRMSWHQTGDKPVSEAWYIGVYASTHWGRDKMTAIFQTIFWNGFSRMKLYEFRLLGAQLTIFQHWFRWWIGADQATSHHLNQRWLVYRRIYASLGLNELTPWHLRVVVVVVFSEYIFGLHSLVYLLGICSRFCGLGHLWWSVNIRLNNGSMPTSSKPFSLPTPAPFFFFLFLFSGIPCQPPLIDQCPPLNMW